MNPLLINPFIRAIKKHVSEMLPYTEALDETLDRLIGNVVNQKDAERLIKLMSEIYSAGYVKAINDTKTKLAAEGIRLKVVKPVN